MHLGLSRGSRVADKRIRSVYPRFFFPSPFLSFAPYFSELINLHRVHSYFENSPYTRRKLRAGLWPHKISDSKNWNFRKGQLFRKERERELLCASWNRNEEMVFSVSYIVCQFSQLICAARLNKLRKESVAGLNHDTRGRGQNTDYLHQYVCARRSEFLFNPRAHRALCVNTNKRIIDLQLARAVQGGLKPKWILNKRTYGSEAEQRAEIDRRAIDTEMKFTTANTPSVFSSVSICHLIRYCPLILDPTTVPIRGVASLFVINKRPATQNYRL